MKEDLEESVHEAKDPIEDEGLESSIRKKVRGRYKLLAPFCDEDRIWRVGGR